MGNILGLSGPKYRLVISFYKTYTALHCWAVQLWLFSKNFGEIEQRYLLT